MNEATTYKELSNDYSEGYDVEPDYDDETGEPEPWTGGHIAGTGQIVTEVTGALADRITARTGKFGTVTIIEDHWDMGYCVTCSSEEVNFIVQVDGEQVYKTDDYAWDLPESAEGLSAYAKFDAWLRGEDTDD